MYELIAPIFPVCMHAWVCLASQCGKSVSLSVSPFVHSSISPFTCPPVRHPYVHGGSPYRSSNCLFIRHFAYLSIHLSFLPSVCLSACSSVYLSICVSIFLSRYFILTLDRYVEQDYTLVYFHFGFTSRNKPNFSWLLQVYRELDRK